MGLRVGNLLKWPWAQWEKKNYILRGHTAAESPPVAREDNRVIEMHGRTRVDPYHWMKDENWQVRGTAVSHPKANAGHISTGMKDEKWQVREAAVEHRNATAGHISAGLKDRNEYVRAAAKRRNR